MQPPAVSGQRDSQHSQLFASLFERVSSDRPLRVFDAGLAVAPTVDFFADFRCRLQFTDLFSELPSRLPEQGAEEPATEQQIEQRLSRQFAALLDFPAGTRFDICLFWDLFNFLDSTALRAFSLALQPYIHRQTLGHGFVQRDRRNVPPDYSYGVVSEQQISLQPCNREPLEHHCHSQAGLERQLHCFTIRRGVLMVDGRLEFLLASTTGHS